MIVEGSNHPGLVAKALVASARAAHVGQGQSWSMGSSRGQRSVGQGPSVADDEAEAPLFAPTGSYIGACEALKHNKAPAPVGLRGMHVHVRGWIPKGLC